MKRKKIEGITFILGELQEGMSKRRLRRLLTDIDIQFVNHNRPAFMAMAAAIRNYNE